MGKLVIDLPYLDRIRAKGRDYYYYRRGNLRQRLPSPKDADFKTEYDRIHRSFQVGRISNARGSLAWLIEQYKQSPSFTEKSDKTRKSYRLYLDMLGKQYGDLQIGGMSRNFVLSLRDSLKDKPRTANYVIQVLRLLLNFAVDRGHLIHNPALRPGRIKTDNDGYRAWTENDVDTV